MNEILKKLEELLNRIDEATSFDIETLVDVRNKLKLYISKFFPNRLEYEELISEVEINPKSNHEYNQNLTKVRSIVTTLIEDIQLGDNNISILTEEDRQKILSQARKEAEIERERIQNEANEIQKLREELQHEKTLLIAEEEKFNTFKTKLEVADKRLDFQQQAKENKVTAIIWAIIAGILTCILVYFLCDSLSASNTFVKIANEVKLGLLNPKNPTSQEIISRTIYFTFFKFVFTKAFLYSLHVFAIIFCVKNYNAQMHNNIINTHKANALKSTLSLLDTARSDDGNDKLLIQATQAIFSHQATGYSGKDNEPSNPNLVTNIVESVAKKI